MNDSIVWQNVKSREEEKKEFQPSNWKSMGQKKRGFENIFVQILDIAGDSFTWIKIVTL